MLPGDYIAMRLTGEINTTVTGLSEGIFWDFRKIPWPISCSIIMAYLLI